MRLRVAKKVCRNRWHRPYRDSTWRTAYRRLGKYERRRPKGPDIKVWVCRADEECES